MSLQLAGVFSVFIYSAATLKNISIEVNFPQPSGLWSELLLAPKFWGFMCMQTIFPVQYFLPQTISA